MLTLLQSKRSLSMTAICITTGRRLLIFLGYSASNDKTIRVWSLYDFECEEILKGHDKFIKTLTESQDNRLLFSGANDNSIKVWDLNTMECIYNFDSHTKWIKTLVVSGKYLFSGANDKRIKVRIEKGSQY